jgi:hypothetical protein
VIGQGHLIEALLAPLSRPAAQLLQCRLQGCQGAQHICRRLFRVRRRNQAFLDEFLTDGVEIEHTGPAFSHDRIINDHRIELVIQPQGGEEVLAGRRLFIGENSGEQGKFEEITRGGYAFRQIGLEIQTIAVGREFALGRRPGTVGPPVFLGDEDGGERGNGRKTKHQPPKAGDRSGSERHGD